MLFRTFVFLSLLVTAGSAAFGQVRTAHEAHVVNYMNHDVTFNVEAGESSNESLQKVRSVLNLSEAQTNGLQTLMKMKQQAIEQIMSSAEETHRKLEALLERPNPNPAEVGTAFLAVRSIQDGIEAAQEKFRTDFKALLSAEQRSALDKLKTATDQIQALERTGILENSLPVPVTMPMLSGEPGFAIGIHGPLSNKH